MANPADRRYLARFIPTMTAYVVIVLGVSWLFENRPPEGAIKYLIAVLPALPIVGIIVILGRYLIEQRDEFIRMRLVMVLLFAMGFTLSLCSIWGFLEIYAGVEHVNVFLVFPVFCLSWLVISPVLAWWYR